jgi:hypothetical protein
VGADDGRVEQEDVQVRVAEGGQDRVPAALPGPAVEPPPLAVGTAEPLGEVGPRGAGAGDPEDGVEEPAVVFGDPAVLARLARQEVLDAVPVGVRDGIAVAHGRPSVAFGESAAYPD